MARRNVCVWRRRPAQAVSSIGDMDFWRARYSSPPTSRLQHEPTTQGLPTTRARQNPRTHAAALPGAEHLNRACQSLTSCTAPPDLLLSAAGPDGLPWHRRRLAISNHTSRLACTPAGLAGPLQHDSHTLREHACKKTCQRFETPASAAVSWLARTAETDTASRHHCTPCICYSELPRTRPSMAKRRVILKNAMLNAFAFAFASPKNAETAPRNTEPKHPFWLVENPCPDARCGN
jgi:hypothetical protein